MQTYSIGQRWVSDMEPELGLGIITEVSPRLVRIFFPAADSERLYAVATAPIRRLAFSAGDMIKLTSGSEFRVTAVENINGLLTYICGDLRVDERDISSIFSFASPKERLLNGVYETNDVFNLRCKALEWRARHLKSPAFGFLGGRIDLIAHQLYVAAEAASRQTPRVLLSDEVGLGKTIEACLIVHRLLLSGRISRVLIIVPESLVHQWFVELLRRFNLVFRIVDADYVASLPEDEVKPNPFDSDQLALCSLAFLAGNSTTAGHALASEWDMVVIDEAHHVLEDSPEYRLVEGLARRSAGLLLLTATPDQLGHRSHFARLKLLDPSRYFDFGEFEKEAEHYQAMAQLAITLLAGEPPSKAQQKLLRSLNLPDNSGETAQNRDQLVRDLVDRYGLGRVMFRNTRAAIPNFPKRQVFLLPLAADASHLLQADAEFKLDFDPADVAPDFDYKEDPRLLWLVSFLKSHKTKVLLICRSIAQVLSIESALRRHINVKAALFHENLSLLQRDRNAAWFAEKDGARLLLCSEIGSEGRNFQFAHHLVLFDVPLDPEVLEQRIGRLDRIGQKQTIHIHVPYLAGSPQETLVRWYHDGFNAFEQNATAAFHIYEKFGQAIREAALAHDDRAVKNLVKTTQQFNKKMAGILEQGRNRLLELNSFHKETAAALKKEIRRLESETDFTTLMLLLFDHFDVHVEEPVEGVFIIAADHITHADFPFPPFRGETIPCVFSRAIALSREDVEFVTPDHPMARGAIDLLLASEKGKTVFARWPSQNPEVLLEAIFVLECLAPARLFIERFFPPTSIRLVVNHHGENLSEKYSADVFNKKCKNTSDDSLLENPDFKQKLFPRMLDDAQAAATEAARRFIQESQEEARRTIEAEIRRLEVLAQVNPNISGDEIQARRQEAVEIATTIAAARLRLDAIRVVVKG